MTVRAYHGTDRQDFACFDIAAAGNAVKGK